MTNLLSIAFARIAMRTLLNVFLYTQRHSQVHAIHTMYCCCRGCRRRCRRRDRRHISYGSLVNVCGRNFSFFLAAALAHGVVLVFGSFIAFGRLTVALYRALVPYVLLVQQKYSLYTTTETLSRSLFFLSIFIRCIRTCVCVWMRVYFPFCLCHCRPSTLLAACLPSTS